MARKTPSSSKTLFPHGFFSNGKAVWLPLLLCGIAFVFYLVPPFVGMKIFPVHEVTVTGAYHLDHAHLQRLLKPLVDRGFFSVSPGRVRDAIRAMPWVSDAMVQRVWPDRLMVTIEEKKPLARWNDASLLSVGGDVFQPDSQSFPEGLPGLTGPVGSQLRVLECYRHLEPLLTSVGLGIASLGLSDALSWEMTLRNGIPIHLGNKDVLTRMGHFVKVYTDIVGSRAEEVESIDLRYPDGFAVRWKKQV